jgi:site-specific DNA-methyltransferase (adenine-specific)
VSWIYGSGFPKSLNISKAIDKAAGVEREVVGSETTCFRMANPRIGNALNSTQAGDTRETDDAGYIKRDITAPATEAAKQWDGWGTALKPSSEFFTLCRKPLSEKTIAANVLKWGTGGINIDGCRVGTDEINTSDSYEYKGNNGGSMGAASNRKRKSGGGATNPQGRFPANLIHDGSQEVLDLFPETKPNDSAARFFYCAKASKKDRDEGLDGFEEKKAAGMAGNMIDGQRLAGDGTPINTPKRKNVHPTVKPTALMQYLCRLITPAGGTVLDPYMGSGSTGKAAMKEGFGFVGCELDPEYYEIASARINAQAEEVGE